MNDFPAASDLHEFRDLGRIHDPPSADTGSPQQKARLQRPEIDLSLEVPMRWLVTIRKNTKVDAVERTLAAFGAFVVGDERPLALSETEEAFVVSGPESLAVFVKRNSEILDVSPLSEFQLVE